MIGFFSFIDAFHLGKEAKGILKNLFFCLMVLGLFEECIIFLIILESENIIPQKRKDAIGFDGLLISKAKIGNKTDSICHHGGDNQIA